MKRRVGASLYFASDKVIFDAMNHARVTTELIKDLLFERNIVVSSHTSKDDLAQYFSRLTADFFDHKNISEKLGKVARRSRITYTEIVNQISATDIINSLKIVKEKIEEEGEMLTIDSQSDRISAHIQYEHIDYTEVEFRQVQPRDAVIEFRKTNDGKYVIRSTQEKYIDLLLDQVISEIEKECKTPITRKKISLIGYADPEVRTNFFHNLVSNISKHNLITVTEAYCYKPDVADRTISDDDEENNESEKKELEDRSYVEKVSLKGTGVTKSFVIDELYNKGYYIVKVAWRVKPASSVDSDIFELEAQFGDPKDCTDFSYQVRGAVICSEGKPTAKKRAPKLEEQDQFFRLIEESAKNAIALLEKP